MSDRSTTTGPAARPEESGEALFDRADEYDAMLQQGLKLSGEDKHFFIHGRLADLKDHLPAAFEPRRILDFGCGIGDTSVLLAQSFPGARVVGAETAEQALVHARRHHGSEAVSFVSVDEVADLEPFDLAYVNGVFHHVPPPQRLRAARLIHDALRPGGCFALFENNPWNPGTRMVMRRIPFDRDAVTLTPPESRALLRSAGFAPLATRYLFIFPRPLRALRFTEALLARLPLGAQYWVLGTRGGGHGVG
ncbi:MAG: class I SAM-dependent methyltransferase [Acidobacteria bacterium]|nr:class I SAM-dependent methyltransferase [Acidobacteriota bacterium]